MTDIILTENGDLPKNPSFGSEDLVIKQRLQIALSKERGENPVDSTDGLPLTRWFQQKPVRIVAIQGFLREYIGDVTGIETVKSLSVSLERKTRTLAVEAFVFGPPLPSGGRKFRAKIPVEQNSAAHLVYYG